MTKSFLANLLIAGFLTLFVLLGCSVEQDSHGTPQAEISEEAYPDFSSIKTDNVFVYNCGDSLQFTAHIARDSTWLFLPDTTLKVTPVLSGSGARYEGNAYLFWSKEQEAIIQKPHGSFLICQVVPEERSWEAARLRGVDFRAQGQEPGWYLEIRESEQLRYIGNYGQDTVQAVVSSLQVQQQRTIYEAETEDHKLKVEIRDDPCTDIMSGFKFPKTVSMAIDGDTYHGCGRPLKQVPQK